MYKPTSKKSVKGKYNIQKLLNNYENILSSLTSERNNNLPSPPPQSRKISRRTEELPPPPQSKKTKRRITDLQQQPPSEIEIINETEIGHGGYGSVFLQTYRKNGIEHRSIVKKMDLEDILINIYEIDIPLRFNHPNIIKATEFYVTHIGSEYKANIYLEKGESLNGQIRLHSPSLQNEKYIIQYLFDVANGMNFLHSQQHPIFHCDIKLENIVLVGDSQETKIAKIIDFSLSGMEEETHTVCGTLGYHCPELQLYKSSGVNMMACDVWSFGKLCLKLFYNTTLEKINKQFTDFYNQNDYVNYSATEQNFFRNQNEFIKILEKLITTRYLIEFIKERKIVLSNHKTIGMVINTYFSKNQRLTTEEHQQNVDTDPTLQNAFRELKRDMLSDNSYLPKFKLLNNLLLRIFDINPLTRITMSEVVTHPFWEGCKIRPVERNIINNITRNVYDELPSCSEEIWGLFKFLHEKILKIQKDCFSISDNSGLVCSDEEYKYTIDLIYRCLPLFESLDIEDKITMIMSSFLISHFLILRRRLKKTNTFNSFITDDEFFDIVLKISKKIKNEPINIKKINENIKNQTSVIKILNHIRGQIFDDFILDNLFNSADIEFNNFEEYKQYVSRFVY